MCGATQQQKQLESEQANFYQTLTAQYAQEFAQNQTILNELQSALAPIIAAGPSQMGFSQAELNTLNDIAINRSAASYAQASQALGEKEAAAAGNEFIPSGAQQALQGQLAMSAENTLSNQLLGIQQAGYQQGYNQYQAAIGALSGVPSAVESPLAGVANAATGAGSAAASEANAIQKASDQWMGLVGGAIAGAAQVGAAYEGG